MVVAHILGERRPLRVARHVPALGTDAPAALERDVAVVRRGEHRVHRARPVVVHATILQRDVVVGGSARVIVVVRLVVAVLAAHHRKVALRGGGAAHVLPGPALRADLHRVIDILLMVLHRGGAAGERGGLGRSRLAAAVQCLAQLRLLLGRHPVHRVKDVLRGDGDVHRGVARLVGREVPHRDSVLLDGQCAVINGRFIAQGVVTSRCGDFRQNRFVQDLRRTGGRVPVGVHLFEAALHIARAQGVWYRRHRHRVGHVRTVRHGVVGGDVGRGPGHVGHAAGLAPAVADNQRQQAVLVGLHPAVGLGIDGRPTIAVRDGDGHRQIRVGHQLVGAVAHHGRVAQLLGGRSDRQQH